MLISPLSTLKSCGSSSMLVLRIMAPTRVIRLSPRIVDWLPSASHPSTRMLRNLSISNILFPRPISTCRKSRQPAHNLDPYRDEHQPRGEDTQNRYSHIHIDPTRTDEA